MVKIVIIGITIRILRIIRITRMIRIIIFKKIIRAVMLIRIRERGEFGKIKT